MSPRIPSKKEYLSLIKDKRLNQQPLDLSYPFIFSKNNHINSRLLENKQKEITLVNQKIAIIKSPSSLFKVGILSSPISTEKSLSYQNADALLDSQIRNAIGQSCDLMITWPGDSHHLFANGFHNAGLEYRYHLKAFDYKKNLNFRINKGDNVSPLALLSAYNKHSVYTHRTLTHFQTFLKKQKSDFFSVWDQNNKLRAYANVETGSEMHGYIHEWGGDINGIMHLLSYLGSQNFAKIILIPHHSFNLRKHLNFINLPFSLNYLGLFKIINKNRLIKKAIQHSKFCKIDNFNLIQQGNSFFLSIDNEALQLKTEKELLTLLFGPINQIDWDGMSETFLKAVYKIFPMPFWLWGWDSL